MYVRKKTLTLRRLRHFKKGGLYKEPFASRALHKKWLDAKEKRAVETSCLFCGRDEARMKCSKCLGRYCDAECQKKDWSIHKQLCK